MDTLRDARPPDGLPAQPSEWERVVRWRYQQLRAAGFSDGLAARLSVTRVIDLHELLALVDRGCPPALAARIVDPVSQGDGRP